jgi:hypothetical protein
VLLRGEKRSSAELANQVFHFAVMSESCTEQSTVQEDLALSFTRADESRNVEIPVTKFVSAPISVSPKSIYLGFVKANQQISRRLTVRAADSLVLGGLTVQEDRTICQSSVLPCVRDGELDLDISVIVPAAGVISTSITIISTTRQPGECSVPICGIVSND